MKRRSDLLHTMTEIPGTIVDFMVTVSMWGIYIGSFIVFFLPFYLYSFLFSRNREASFQRINWTLYRFFFAILRILTPKITWQISDDVKSIHSSVIIVNHVSFLDPILLVSLFPAQKTFVKNTFFKIPVFGWIMRTSGYIPARGRNTETDTLLGQLDKMKDYLAGGGNLFIFPEGTRSRDCRVGQFEYGAFRIAKFTTAPIKVVVIRNTGRLFPPDRFLFNRGRRFVISVELAGTLTPDYNSDDYSIGASVAQARKMIQDGVAS